MTTLYPISSSELSLPKDPAWLGSPLRKGEQDNLALTLFGLHKAAGNWEPISVVAFIERVRKDYQEELLTVLGMQFSTGNGRDFWIAAAKMEHDGYIELQGEGRETTLKALPKLVQLWLDNAQRPQHV